MLQYLKTFGVVLFRHGGIWWGSLIFLSLLGAGVAEDYWRLRDFINGQQEMFSMPDEPSVWWLLGLYLLWLLGSLIHDEIMRSIKAAQIVFGEAGIRYAVPLYSAGVLDTYNDIAWLEVSNEPHDMENGKTIERAFCKVEIFEAETSKKLKSFSYPRWLKNPKPGYHDHPRDHFPDLWNYRDIHPTGDKEQIEFAVKAINESDMFGFTGRSQIGDIKWKRQDLKLPRGNYYMKLTISGIGLSRPVHQWLKVHNEGVGRSLKVEKIARKPIPWVFPAKGI